MRMPGVASTALLGLLDGPGTAASVLGTSRHAVWLAANNDVIVVSTADTTRLPNGVQISTRSQEDPFRLISHGESASVGHRSLILETVAVNVTRWWDPRPVLVSTDPEHLITAVADLPDSVTHIDPAPLRSALQTRSAAGIVAASHSLLGKGPGLTPEGDDYLAGALAATYLLGEALGREQISALIDSISTPLARLAAERTTSLSAALIRCALRGYVAEPAGALLRALTGRGDVTHSHLRLAQVGHSSGPALAAGVVLGARSI